MKLSVSEHAIYRYLERTGRIDVEALKREILTEKVQAALRVGASALTADGLVYVLRKGEVVSIWRADDSKRGINRQAGVMQGAEA